MTPRKIVQRQHHQALCVHVQVLISKCPENMFFPLTLVLVGFSLINQFHIKLYVLNYALVLKGFVYNTILGTFDKAEHVWLPTDLEKSSQKNHRE